MTKKCCWSLLAYSVVLFGSVLDSALLFDRIGEQRRGEKEKSDNHITVDHVRRTTDKPFGDVTTAFEQKLGRFEPGVYQALAAGGDAEGARAKIEAMAGPSGFMLFATHNHGALLRLAGQQRKAIQYVVGNPLFALQMTQHDIRASLYAPLRVLIYENEERSTGIPQGKWTRG